MKGGADPPDTGIGGHLNGEPIGSAPNSSRPIRAACRGATPIGQLWRPDAKDAAVGQNDRIGARGVERARGKFSSVPSLKQPSQP